MRVRKISLFRHYYIRLGHWFGSNTNWRIFNDICYLCPDCGVTCCAFLCNACKEFLCECDDHNCPAQLPFIISDNIPEYNTTIEDERLSKDKRDVD